jgi:hypothetical protein
MHLQIVFLDHGVRPYAAHDLVIRDQGSLRADQQLENVECAVANAQRLAVNPDLPALRDMRSCPIRTIPRSIPKGDG